MKRVKVIMTSAVILLAVGGAFASKSRSQLVYSKLLDSYPGQTQACQLRGSCTGTGALCRVIIMGSYYQMYYAGCITSANGLFSQ
jgi:hypothetical protein